MSAGRVIHLCDDGGLRDYRFDDNAIVNGAAYGFARSRVLT
jgi:hypothetical protein